MEEVECCQGHEGKGAAWARRKGAWLVAHGRDSEPGAATAVRNCRVACAGRQWHASVPVGERKGWCMGWAREKNKNRPSPGKTVPFLI
jgi:hypothetical protein